MKPYKQIGIIANLKKKNALTIAKRVIQYIRSKEKNIIFEEQLAKRLKQPLGFSKKEVISRSDLVMSLGGDGTLLSVAREIGDKTPPPIVGINLGGGLGFLTAISLTNLESSLDKILRQDFVLEKRTTLKVSVTDIQGKKIQYTALNDIVINRETLSRLLTLKILIDNEYLTHYKSDGLIIATPTGSTAYSLAAGGSIVYPGTKTTLVTPICPHTVSNRPLIIPQDKTVTIQVIEPFEKVMITIDGQIGTVLNPKQEVTISPGKKVVTLVSLRENSFFKILREKLNWAGHSQSK